MSEQRRDQSEERANKPDEGNNTLSPDLEAALREAEAHAEVIEDQRKRPDQSGEAGAAQADENQSSEASSPDEQVDALRAELAQAKAQMSDMREGMLRARADLENARRRFEREQKEGQLYAGERVLKSIIPVVDDLDRALENIPADLDEDNSLVSGVNMVHRKFLQALETQGAVSFYPQGELFDPTNHEALMEAPSDEVPAGHICQVFQRGWRLNDRLLRPAKVIIAKSID
jgi:molecular chaperone GrpE